MMYSQIIYITIMQLIEYYLLLNKTTTVWYDIYRRITMQLEEWKSQLKRGVLEYFILSLIQGKDYYGYEIIKTLETVPLLASKESTVYPILRRLLKEDLLESYWQEGHEGVPPRKYYRISALGKAYLIAMHSEWENLVTSIKNTQDKSETKEGDHEHH